VAYLRPSETDRKRYNLPEQIDFKPGEFGLKAVKQLERQTGFSIDHLQAAIEGVPVLDEHGQQVYEPVEDVDGNPVLDEAGNPTVEEKVYQDPEAMAALAWLILWSNGHRIPWEEFDVVPMGMKLSFLEDGEVEGKAEATEADTSSTTTVS
jgi:hypothetical protein